MSVTSLQAIRQKIRFLTKTPSAQLLTDAAIDEYINTFILYDFPEHLRLFELHSTFSFYCQPFIDTYITDDTLPVTDPLFDFKNKYITVNPPVYIAGYLSGYYQSREQFYRMWPQVDSIQQQNAGDGITTTYTGVILNGGGTPPPSSGQQSPILQNFVLFDSIDINGNGLALVDYPVSATTGALGLPGQPQTLPSPFGQINYITGAYTVNFPTAPAIGAAINSQVYFYVPSRPLSMLYYDNKFTLRPIPDQPYQIQFEVYRRPIELLATNQSPEMNQWWQYIAYGAALKRLQDIFDYDSVQLITPEFKAQQELVLRRTVVQNTTQRVATIYSQTSDMGSGWGNWNGFGQSGI